MFLHARLQGRPIWEYDVHCERVVQALYVTGRHMERKLNNNTSIFGERTRQSSKENKAHRETWGAAT